MNKVVINLYIIYIVFTSVFKVSEICITLKPCVILNLYFIKTMHIMYSVYYFPIILSVFQGFYKVREY